MTFRLWVKIICFVVGLAALAALIWFAGPLLSVGDSRPFDSPTVRIIMVVLAAVAVFTAIGYEIVSRMRAVKELSGNLSTQSEAEQKEAAGDQDVIQEKMKDALATLKKAKGSSGDYLYDLPWYVIIGPPGSGKTTALINSGLKFPLSRGATPSAVAGTGGTRYCDWWFTEDAVLIDTAGRYTTQDSDSAADAKSWLSFLDILKRNRPKQPINGVMVAISVQDLLTLTPKEVQAHSDAIRARLIELHKHLKVDFPVYALFTKADLIAGFMEYFGNLNEAGRRIVWGATFQTNDKTQNMVGEVPAQFDLLIERINLELVDRLQEEATPSAKVQVFGFPSQMAALKKPIFDFLNQIFEPTRYHSNATLRGFYFTSGTQEGTPIDQLIGALSRSFGAQQVAAAQYSGLGKSFFLTNLLTEVIFGEAGWVSTNRGAVRRAAIIKTLAYSGLVLACVGLGTVWWISYGRNSNLTGETYQSVVKYKSIAGLVRDETVVADNDFRRVAPTLYHLRTMPTGYAARNDSVPTLSTFGLSQFDRLKSASGSAYEAALQRQFRSRILFRLESFIRQNMTSPGLVTEALKVYLMVGGKEPVDKPRVTEWIRRDWRENLYPGAADQLGRQSLEEHLAAMLDYDPPEGIRAIEIDDALVDEARRTIARMSVADRAWEILRASATTQGERDWTARKKAGPDAALVFEGNAGADLDQVRVPFLYTYAGFQEAFLARLEPVIKQVQQERGVLGDIGGQQAITVQYDTLAQTLLDRYTKEHASVWRAALAKLRIKLLTADRPRYLALQAAAAPTSPIASLLASIREETLLTRERVAPPPAPGAPPAAAPASPPPLGKMGGEVPGATAEANFRAFHAVMEGDGGKRAIDELLRGLSDLQISLTKINDPTQAAQGNVLFREQLQSLRSTATRFPDPFKAMLQNAANAFDGDATGTSLVRLQQSLQEQVTRQCQPLISGAYPFVRASETPISIEKFTQIFGPNGVLDRFYTVNLASLVDTSKPQWTWVATNPVARQLPPAMLNEFKRASEIRQAFFPSGAPAFQFAVQNLVVGDGLDAARLEVNGAFLNTEKPKPAEPPPPAGPLGGFLSPAPPPPPPPPKGPPPPPQINTFSWPGPVGLSKAVITVTPSVEAPGRLPPNLQRDGAWGIFKLVELGSPTPRGEALVTKYSIGGREVQYQINVLTKPNPFTAGLATLRDFKCPAF
jgi:type VI secretion system protein ImpL